MRKFLICSLIIFLPFSSSSQESIHFLDVDYLLNNSNYGKQIILKLKEINDKNLIKIKNYEDQLKKEDKQLENVKNIISQDELNLKVNELKKKITHYRDQKDKIFNEYQIMKNKELELFFKKITPIIEEFMEINSIKLIMDKKNIFIANANYDITEELIMYLNSKLIK